MNKYSKYFGETFIADMFVVFVMFSIYLIASAAHAGTVNNSRTGNPLIFIGPYIVGNCVEVAAGGNVADSGAPCGGGGGGGNVNSINADTTAAQTLTVGTSGTDFNISDPGAGAHVFNLPDAGTVNRGALTPTDWTTFNNKVGGGGNSPNIAYWNSASSITANIYLTYAGVGDATGAFLGVGTTNPLEKAHIVGNAIITGQVAIGDSAQAGLVSSTQRYVDIAQTITDFTATNSWRLHSDRLIVDPAADLQLTRQPHHFRKYQFLIRTQTTLETLLLTRRLLPTLVMVL